MKEETEARFYGSLKHLNDTNKEMNKDDFQMTNEELEECCRFVYVTKDKLKSFIKEYLVNTKHDESKLLWEILSQNNSSSYLEVKDITKQQFRKVIKMYTNITDEEINEIGNDLCPEENGMIRKEKVENL